MSNCKVCGSLFVPKRKEQVLCSILCRQKHNSAKQKKWNRGPNKSDYKPRMTEDGYLRMYAAQHPYANGRREVHVHVMVMEMSIGRAITKNEVVHHKNGIKTDNRLENLELMSHTLHSSMHSAELVLNKKRDANGRFARN